MRRGPLKSFSLLFIFLFLSLGAATAAAEPIDNCDPETDPYACECSNELQDLGECRLIEEANLPDYTYPLDADLSFISTAYDPDREVYIVHADLSQTTGLGMMKPNANGGRWDTLEQLHGYLSDLLGVPLNDAGYLRHFEYSQIGISERYYRETEELLPSTGRFWLDAISDLDGNVWVGGEKHVAYSGSSPTVSCFPSHASNEVWSDTGSDSLHAISSSGDLEYDLDTKICANEHETGVQGRLGSWVDTKAKSAIHNTSIVLQFGSTREPLFQCDADWNCKVVRRRQLLPEGLYGNHIIRIFNPTMDDLQIDHTHYRAGSRVYGPTQEAVTLESYLLHTDDPLFDSSANPKDPVFDQVCGKGYARFGNHEADANYTKGRLTTAENPPAQDVMCP